MPGTLYHSRQFTTDAYIAIDGLEHYEIDTVDGGCDFVSATTWKALCERLAAAGAPAEAIPEYEQPFDLSIDEIRKRSTLFSEWIKKLAPGSSTEDDLLLNKIRTYVEQGEYVFYTYL